MKKTFAERMREGMRIRKMKQVDLVEKTGITKSAISQYYRGKHEPRQDGIYLIAKALDVDEAWLMGYDIELTKHYDNDWTQEELTQIEKYKEFLRSQRKWGFNMTCPRCGSSNIQITNEVKLKKKHGCIWWCLIGWWLFLLIGLFVLIFSGRKKAKNTAYYNCMNCGNKWKV